MHFEDGKLKLTDGIFMTYFWGFNLLRFFSRLWGNGWVIKMNPYNPKFPKTSCSFWKGFLLIPLSLVASIAINLWYGVWNLIVLFIVIFFAFGIFPIIGFLFGYIRDWRITSQNFFHPYLKYGKDDEKKLPINPATVWVPALGIWIYYPIVSKYPAKTMEFVREAGYYAGWAVVCGIIIVAVYGLISLGAKKGTFHAIYESWKAFKGKYCLPVEIEHKI